MNPRLFILTELYDAWRSLMLYNDYGTPRWGDRQFVRACVLRLERDDATAWGEFVDRLKSIRPFASAVRAVLENAFIVVERDSRGFELQLNLPNHVACFEPDEQSELLRLLDERYCDQRVLAHWLANVIPNATELNQLVDAKAFITPTNPSRGEIRYIEMKPGLSGQARIGRVTFSKTHKTIYYDGKTLQSLKGNGFKANYYDIESAMWYWVSKCRKDGNDRLYPGVIEIDDDVREEYWTEIRKRRENKHVTQFRSEGKHSK